MWSFGLSESGAQSLAPQRPETAAEWVQALRGLRERLPSNTLDDKEAARREDALKALSEKGCPPVLTPEDLAAYFALLKDLDQTPGDVADIGPGLRIWLKIHPDRRSNGCQWVASALGMVEDRLVRLAKTPEGRALGLIDPKAPDIAAEAKPVQAPGLPAKLALVPYFRAAALGITPPEGGWPAPKKWTQVGDGKWYGHGADHYACLGPCGRGHMHGYYPAGDVAAWTARLADAENAYRRRLEAENAAIDASRAELEALRRREALGPEGRLREDFYAMKDRVAALEKQVAGLLAQKGGA